MDIRDYVLELRVRHIDPRVTKRVLFKLKNGFANFEQLSDLSLALGKAARFNGFETDARLPRRL